MQITMFRPNQALARTLAASLALLLCPLVQAQADASTATAAAASVPTADTASSAPAAPSVTPGATAAAAGAQAAPSAAASAPAVAVHVGKVSYYGRRFAGRKTAIGELFDPNALTMAHRSLPFGTRVRVTNLKTGHSVVVRVNDHGPNHAGRIGDVSHAAAVQLHMVHAGVVRARLEVLGGAHAKAVRKGTRKARQG